MRRDSKRKSSKNNQKAERARNGSKEKAVQEATPQSDTEENAKCSDIIAEERDDLIIDENENVLDCSVSASEKPVTPAPEDAEVAVPDEGREALQENSDKDNSNDGSVERDRRIESDVPMNSHRFAGDAFDGSTSPPPSAALCSGLNYLMTRALSNVKMEPMDMSVSEKYAQNLISSMAARFSMNGFNGQEMMLRADKQGAFDDPYRMMPFRPPAELSPETFAEQLRHNESASMVVCRSQMGKNAANQLGLVMPPESPPCGGGRVSSGQSGSLHHFVTRYTVERPDDPSRLGVDICLEGGNPDDPVIEVECGGNKGLLYVTKLCQGSKGQSILFNDEWLTPNEFQFISGRETAKDWKRSIRHCGKSLKTLMTKGVLQVHPPVCECDYCKGHGHALADKMVKKRALQTPFHDGSKSAGSPASCADTSAHHGKSLYPLDSPASSLHKQGREGGLNSIISQLHNKKASNGCDAPSVAESLDLSIRSHSATPGNPMNGRKRSRDSSAASNRECDLPPFKRSHSSGNVPECRDGQEVDTSSSISEPLCLSSSVKDKENTSAVDMSKFFNSGKRPPVSVSRHHNDRSSSGRHQDGPFPLSPTPPAHRQYPEDRAYRPRPGYAEYAFYDAMKRAVANLTYGSHSNGYSTPPTGLPSPSPRQGENDRYYDPSHRPVSPNDDSSANGGVKQPMVELVSPHRMASRNPAYHPDADLRNRYRNERGYDNLPTYDKSNGTASYRYSRYAESRYASGSRADAFPSPDAPAWYHSSSRSSYPSAPDQGFHPGHHDHSGKSARYDRRSKTLRKHASPAHQKQRQRPGSQRHQAPRHRMLNLHNHAIPMVSLAHSNKKHNDNERNKELNGNPSKRNTDSSPPVLGSDLKKTLTKRGSLGSDVELAQLSDTDAIRRLSSSAPPPQYHGDGPDAASCFSYHDPKSLNAKGKTGSEFGSSYLSGRFRTRESQSQLELPTPNQNGVEESAFRDVKSSRFSISNSALSPDSVLSNFDDVPPRNAGFFNYQAAELQRIRDLSSAVDEMSRWSVDGVCDFLRRIGCEQYEQVFRDNFIDGDALPLLMECHLTGSMGLKLGHALKVIARVQRRLGSYHLMLSGRSTTKCFHGRNMSAHTDSGEPCPKPKASPEEKDEQ